MRRLWLTCLAAIALVTPALAPRPASSAGPYDFSLTAAAINSSGLGGASMIVVRNDGEVAYEGYFGSFNASTGVFIASATKWISASVFMSLVDEGLISLDDPVSMYLPDWTGDYGAITMRQLWSHTSGLPGDHACLADGTITLTACVAQIRATPMLAPVYGLVNNLQQLARDSLYGDGDGCSDAEELGGSAINGGRRNPALRWDFYDVNGTLKVDSVDIALVRSKFNPAGPVAPADIIYDRSVGAAPWAPGPPDGKINAVDIGLVRTEFNHSCQAAP